MARRLRKHCHGMKLKIQSMPCVWFPHPPIPKKGVKKKKKVTHQFLIAIFPQRRLLGLSGSNWAQLSWHPWRIIFLYTSVLNVHVSPVSWARSHSGWLPDKSESSKLPIQNGTRHLLHINSVLVNSSRFWTPLLHLQARSPCYWMKMTVRLEAPPAGGTF